MKSSLMALLLFAVGGVRADDPTISITATPRYPWNGKVDLAFTIADSDVAGGYAEAEPGDELIPGRRLKYVQSCGTEQLNTGIVPNSKNTIELKIAWESQPGVNGCLFCARGATTSTSTFTGFLIGSKWRFDYNGTIGTESATPTLVSGKAVVIRDVAGTASVDGTSVQSHTAASFTVGGPLTLFSSYVTAPGTTVANHVCAKVYYLRIYDNDGVTLVHDFQPWEKDGEIGLYDLVAKRFVAPNVGSLSAGVKYDTSFTAQDVIGGTNLMMKTLYKSNGAAANVGKEALLPGTYNWVWDAEADLAHRWVTYSGCLPTNSAVLFSNVQLSELSEFYAVPCGMSVSGKSNLAKGAYIKNDGTGKSVQFAFSDDVYTKCVCVHLEQSGANVVGHAKWARYVSGTGHENSDFETNSATQLGVATSDSERGYGLHKLEAKGPKLDSAPVIERVITEGNVEVSAFLYTVKFNANGGTGTMANESFAYGIEKALTANAFTRTGYTFQGWATSAGGAIAYSNKQEVSNLSVTAGATVNLYAAWKANTYSVKFNANGGTGTMSNESFTYGTAKALTANAFTRTGFAFDGWAKSASGTKAYSDKQSVSNLTATAGGTFNLYAVWKATGGVQLWANGPYWAECNVGATKPEQYGYYFWWGDTKGYKRVGSSWNAVDGSKTGFSFSSGNCSTYNKTVAQLKSAGYADSSGNLVAKYDAATAHLGAPWRMPAGAEFSALFNNCTTKWTTRNGVYGRLVSGKGSFSTKSIFLPAAGHGRDSSLINPGSYGDYWSSTPDSDDPYGAWFLSFYSGNFFYRGDNYRYIGQSVRPLRGFAQ